MDKELGLKLFELSAAHPDEDLQPLFAACLDECQGKADEAVKLLEDMLNG